MTQLIASNQLTLTNLKEKAIDRTEISFWHGLSATKHPIGVYDCGFRDHIFGNEFSVTSGKTYTVRVIAKQTKGSLNLAGGIWYTSMTSGNAWDGYAPFALVGEASEEGLGIYERKFVVESGKTKAKIYILIEQPRGGGSTAWRIYDGQVFDENGQPLVTDQNNLGALTSPMAAPNGTYIWKRTVTYYTDGTSNTIWEYNGVGANGKTGANGRTPYIHWAYADNADGTGLTITDNGQRYMGHYSDYTQADSTDKTMYRWADRWAKIEAGNGNLLRWTTVSSENLKYFIKSDSATLSIELKEGKNAYKIAIANSNHNTDNGAFFNSNENPDGKGPTFNLYPNCRYTFTFSVWSSVSIPFNYVSLGHHQVIGSSNVSDAILHQHRDASWSVSSIKQGEWQRVSYSFTAISLSYFRPFFWYLPAGIEIYIADMMLSDGNIKLPWQPSHLDLVSSIESKADQALTQEQLNALNERNQILESEMKAKASMEAFSELEKAYYAFVSKNEKDSAQSEQDLIEAGRRIELLTTQFGGLKELKTFIDTYMSSSNEGLIVGKNDASSTIKVSSDRISMFSAGKEVMYISQGVININNGIFTVSVQIGKFRTEQYHLNADMNVIRYVG